LAAAIGCAEEDLGSITERVDLEAEHVLGALIVARQARRDCPELDAALSGWDGIPTAEVAGLAPPAFRRDGRDQDAVDAGINLWARSSDD